MAQNGESTSSGHRAFYYSTWFLLLLVAALGVWSYRLWEGQQGRFPRGWARQEIVVSRHETGHAYQSELATDSLSSHKGPSSAKVLEDGRPLGPGNSQHQDIRTIGRGSYSFWHKILYLSSSDNSDPRTNGRRYEIAWPSPADPRMAMAAYSATVIAFLLFAVGAWLAREDWHATFQRLGRPAFLRSPSVKRRIPRVIAPKLGGNRACFHATWVLALLCVSLGAWSYGFSERQQQRRQDRGFQHWVRQGVFAARHETGHAYQADLETDWMSSHERPSPAKVLEDGRPLGPGNCQHEDIRNLGGGRYSFWHKILYFSSSDNSDPRSNGRKYEIAYPKPLEPQSNRVAQAAALVALLSLLPAAWIAREDWKATLRRVKLRSVAVCGVAAAAGVLGFGVYALFLEPVATLERADVIRTIVVLFFLALFGGLYLGRCLGTKPLQVLDLLIRLPALGGTALYLLFRPNIVNSIQSAAPYVISLGLLSAAAAIAGFLRARKRPAMSPSRFSGWADLPARALDSVGLAGLIACLLMLFLPTGLLPIVKYWDVSGWMDSRAYDMFAHDIATGKVPQGNSNYMPVYQYGMAFLYYVFGHFFFVQQIFNLILAMAAIALLCLASWNLFRSRLAVLLAGTWAAFSSHLCHAIHYTQIEGWYVPAVCLLLFAWSCYVRNPSAGHLVLMSLCIGLVFNIRSQGFVYLGVMCLAPLFVRHSNLGRKLAHACVAVLITGASLVPWSIRNYVVENRFSPTGVLGAQQMAVLNDRRVGFYGIRYDIGYREVVREYETRYPDAADREKAMMRDAWKKVSGDPVWLANAIRWRTLAFYGLLPPGVWAVGGPAPTDWKTQGSGYLYWATPFLFMLLLSCLGFFRPGREMIFLLCAVAGNLSIVVFSGFGEPRLSYPVFPIHILTGLFVFCRRPHGSGDEDWSIAEVALAGQRGTYWAASLLGAGAFAFLCHATIGSAFAYRPLRERAVTFSEDVRVDAALPSLNDYLSRYRAWSRTREGPAPESLEGRKIRVRLIATNNMFPPKFSGRVPLVPDFATDPLGETYYIADLPRTSGGAGHVGISYFGARLASAVYEGDVIEVEGTLIQSSPDPQLYADFWVKADKVQETFVDWSTIPAAHK